MQTAFAIIRPQTTWVLVLLLGLVFLVSGGQPAAAASLIPSLSLPTIAPKNPTVPPNSDVEVTATLSDATTIGSTLRWYVDETELLAYRNQRTARVPTGPLGTETVVRLVITRQNGTSLEASTRLRPISIDIALEAETYVPPTYAGLALPTRGSPLRLVALVHGATGAANTLSYEWLRDGKSINGGPQLGQAAISVVQNPYSNENFSVRVYDAKGLNIGSGFVRPTLARPTLVFYENSPSRGLSFRALTGETPLIERTLAVTAVPYYMTGSPQTGAHTTNWRIDGQRVAGWEQSQFTLPLELGEGRGLTSVRLDMRTNRRIPELFEGTFSLLVN
jgi:hypothetical protein